METDDELTFFREYNVRSWSYFMTKCYYVITYIQFLNQPNHIQSRKSTHSFPYFTNSLSPSVFWWSRKSRTGRSSRRYSRNWTSRPAWGYSRSYTTALEDLPSSSQTTKPPTSKCCTTTLFPNTSPTYILPNPWQIFSHDWIWVRME